MTQVVDITGTEGELSSFAWQKLFLGRGLKILDGGITSGKIDEDTARIKLSAIKINLSEEEAIALVDRIRDALPINK